MFRPHTVTLDCWGTLLYEKDRTRGPAARARLLAQSAGVDPASADAALTEAWRKHASSWHRGVAFGARDMTLFALQTVGCKLGLQQFDNLVAAMENAALDYDVYAIEGAREALERLAQAGVRRALICDTGFSPGRVVRAMLDRVRLRNLLEVCVFSDEVGVPKPHPRMFSAALDALGVAAKGAVHVGDMRRSDIAGARSHGMRSVRLTAHNDDADAAAMSNTGVIDCGAAGCDPPCARPEADAVVASYPELMQVLGFDRA
jgi:putative hydrolase of the HAD superfamily